MMKQDFTKRFSVNTALLFFCCLLLLTAGCAGKRERTPLPEELAGRAVIPGVPNARFYRDEWPEFSVKIFKTATPEEIQAAFPGVYGKPHTYLAISGGGAEGAYGAGLLNGWTAAGTRPEFSMVTGISTGALSAPFAFLGTDYDHILKEVYTSTQTSDILERKGAVSAIMGDSVVDSAPLRKLIARYVNEEVIEAIGAAYRQGRKLIIGTFNLDAARSVIWDIGAIANSDYDKKNDLIHDILLASASIPVAFPPVLIQVSAEGKMYDEMHVDGGTGAQVFIYPASFGWREILEDLKTPEPPRVFVIRNSFLDTNYSEVSPEILPIAGRSISALISTQGVGDLYQIFLLCKRDGNEFNLAYIPSSFKEEAEEPFDPDYMGKLYQLGFDKAVHGYPWKKEPPGLLLTNE